MKKILTFLMIILFLHPASAYIYLNIYIEENGEAIFLGETNEQLSLPEGISLENGIIRGSTQSLTSKEGEVWTFSYSLEVAELNIIFPGGVTLISISNGEISIDNNKISVYAQNSMEATYTIGEEQSEFPYIPFTITLILLIILTVFYYLKRKKKKIKLKEIDKLEIIKKVLSDREKLILDTLKKSGKTKSSYLRKLTELPKASFSRHVQELEKKKLIKRTGEGRNKFVEIQ